MTEQFDEGVKEILMALFAIGAGIYEADYVAKQLTKRPEPVQQKVQALNQLKEKEPENNKLDASIDRVIKQIQQRAHHKISHPKYATVVKPKVQYNVDKHNDSVIAKRAAKFIIPFEIYGNDVSDARNKRLLTPYKDDKGYWTVGIGHLIGNGSDESLEAYKKQRAARGKSPTLTPEEAISVFVKELEHHVKKAKGILGPTWDSLSLDLQSVLVDICYRGDLVPKNLEARRAAAKKDKSVSLNLDFVDDIKKGDFKKAATEYLDHKEYKSRAANKKDGVVKRMERNSKIIAGESTKSR